MSVILKPERWLHIVYFKHLFNSTTAFNIPLHAAGYITAQLFSVHSNVLIFLPKTFWLMEDAEVQKKNKAIVQRSAWLHHFHWDSGVGGCGGLVYVRDKWNVLLTLLDFADMVCNHSNRSVTRTQYKVILTDHLYPPTSLPGNNVSRYTA